MKKLFLALLLLPSLAFAGELETKQAQLNAVQWEYRFTVERQATLKAQAEKLAAEIKALQEKSKEVEKVE